MKHVRDFWTFGLLILVFGFFLAMQACDTTLDDVRPEEPGIGIATRKKPKDPPPPPPPVYFDNFGYAELSEPLLVGYPTDATLTLHYVNSPGGTYPAFTSNTVNGIYFTTPAGVLNVGSGNITFTANGTPEQAGYTYITLEVQGVIPCNRLVAVQNAPAQGPCSDPGPAVGSTGCVTFSYMGQEVTYSTVRAEDGKIWLQQNLGSPQVAFDYQDAASYGHYFQWGRWDDGHQVPTGPTVAGNSTLQNPAHIPNGNPNFITGATNSTAWWGAGTSADTWSSSPPSATNGFDPGTALGAGWHIPTATEWENVIVQENIIDDITAFQSNLKLTTSGYRHRDEGSYYPNWSGGNYWSSSPSGTNMGNFFFFNEIYTAEIQQAHRGFGMNVRLVKD